MLKEVEVDLQFHVLCPRKVTLKTYGDVVCVLCRTNAISEFQFSTVVLW